MTDKEMAALAEPGNRREYADTPLPPEPIDGRPAVSGALIAARGKEGAVAIADGDRRLATMRTSLKGGTLGERALVLRVMGPSPIEWPEKADMKIKAVGYMLYDDEGANEETGEIGEFTRSALVMADGSHVRTTSDTVAQQLRVLIGMTSPEEWASGIPLKLSSEIGRRKRRYHCLGIDV